MLKRNILFILLFVIAIKLYAQTTESNKPYLLVVSMDAFRWDYQQIYKLPYLDSITKWGVKARSFQPCFPTVTFPNHYSMATGLFPDNHGIVQNKFYDKELDMVYRIGDRKAVMDGRFYGGEPIWVTAENQGIKTASFYWVGSEARINGIQPSYWKIYENKIPFSQRIDTLMYWFQLPEAERPHLVMFYLPEPDETTHDFGPISNESKIMLTYLDSLMGILFQKIKSLPIGNQINVIVTSDHGMAQLDNKKTINIDNYIKQEWIKGFYGYNPTYNITVADNCKDSVYNALKNIPHLNVWKTGKLPERLHYGRNKRIGDIVLLAELGWSIIRQKDKPPYGGAHGFDNKEMDMHGIFYAFGSAFKTDFKVNTLENIQLYNIMTRVLKLKPAKNDANPKLIEEIFRK